MTKTISMTRKLTEGAIMIALATVLSLIKLVDMPYGGSVTCASMLPMVIIAYRHGIGFGLGTGAVYAVLQQLLGLNMLSYVTGWQSVLAVILLDYVLAFTAVGIGGIFRKKGGTDADKPSPKIQSRELVLGMLLVCVVRYTLHVIAGATVWAGLSIPTEAALIYSLGYNATYMIPETVVNSLVALWLGGVLDFSRSVPVRFVKSAEAAHIPVACNVLPKLSLLVAVVAVAFTACEIFRYLQDAEDGHFTFDFISQVNWLAIGIVCTVAAAAIAAMLISSAVIKHKAADAN